MKYENVIEINVARCLGALARRWKFLLWISALFAIAGAALGMPDFKDKYEASASVYSVSYGSISDSTEATSAMNYYVDVASSLKVCNRAATQLDYDLNGAAIQEMIEVNLSTNEYETVYYDYDSSMVIITATSEDPVMAMDIADAVADAFVVEMNNILGSDEVQVLDEAYSYEKSYDAAANLAKSVFKMFALGLIFAMVVVVIMEIFNKKVRTIREGSLYEQLPVIGVVPDKNIKR
ncbi:MAG: hypothetical protein K6G40_05795 [Eubacterium sp.]|nr:hypothetical protein [Eubacterium sp.]